MREEKLQELRAHRLAGHTWEDIRKMYGVSTGTIAKRWSRALNRRFPELQVELRERDTINAEVEYERQYRAVMSATSEAELRELWGVKRSAVHARINVLSKRGYKVELPKGFYSGKYSADINGSLERAVVRRLTSYRKRAAKKGLGFDLDVTWVVSQIAKQGGRCMYTGVQMGTANDHDLITVDRIDSGRGYTKGNCVLCCRWVNTAKMAMSIREFGERMVVAGRWFEKALGL